jgi:hypothetical protein
MTSDAERREIYMGSADWEGEPEHAAVLARMERLAEVRIAVGELFVNGLREAAMNGSRQTVDEEAARYAAEEKSRSMMKKETDGK